MSWRKISELRTVVPALAAALLFAQAVQPQKTVAFMQQSAVAPTESSGCAAGAPEPEPTRKLVLADVPNFGQVTAMLLRGGQPTSQGFAELRKQGVMTVVNLREENVDDERAVVEAQGMQYRTIPWSCHDPNNESMAKFLSYVHDHPNEKIFVHCHYGTDRTGMMIAAYRMAEQGWTPQQALSEMVRFGFNFLHRSWCHQLKSYLANFPQQLVNDPELQPLRVARMATSPCTP